MQESPALSMVHFGADIPGVLVAIDPIRTRPGTASGYTPWAMSPIALA